MATCAEQGLGIETKTANAIANKQPGKFIVRANSPPECWEVFNSEVRCDTVALIRNFPHVLLIFH